MKITTILRHCIQRHGQRRQGGETVAFDRRIQLPVMLVGFDQQSPEVR